MKPSRSREVYGPGIGGANTSIESCEVEADCAVCGRHFAAYTGYKKWPYRLTIDDQPPQKGGRTNRMVCSWGCLCQWRREHPAKAEKEDAVTVPLPEKSPDAVRALARSMGMEPPKKAKKPEPELFLADMVLPEGFILHYNTVTNFDRWKLAGLRAEREMSRATLQRLSGITIGGIRELEYGKNLPKPGTVLALAKALGVEPKELLKDKD